MMRNALIAGLILCSIAAGRDWLTGKVVAITLDYQQSATHTTVQQTGSGRVDATSTPSGYRQAEYMIRAADGIFTLRVVPGTASKLLNWGAPWANRTRAEVPGMRIGAAIDFAVDGSHGWIRAGGKEYRCEVVRQEAP